MKKYIKLLVASTIMSFMAFSGSVYAQANPDGDTVVECNTGSVEEIIKCFSKAEPKGR